MLAIQNFVDGVKDGTMLKHRLLLEEPSTVAEMMAIADKYAMVSASMKVQLWLDDDGHILNGDQLKAAGEAPAGSARRATTPKQKQCRLARCKWPLSRKRSQPAPARTSVRRSEECGSRSSHTGRCSTPRAAITAA